MKTYIPEVMNIELTTACPLRCPQCYCHLSESKHIELETAIYWIREGVKNGVKNVMLSGGETLCYPYIYEIVTEAKKICNVVNMAISGYGFTENVLERLINSGISGIFVSLNGSTEEINSYTRDGYDFAISALQLLYNNKFRNTHISWVMHANNSDDFRNVIQIAEKYNVKGLVILSAKPDSNYSLHSTPTKNQMHNIRKAIRNHRGNVQISVQTCFSPLLAFLSDIGWLGNLNVGNNKGCGAGRNMFSVSVDGLLSPCRHLEYLENHTTLESYWNASTTIQKLREIDNSRREPCISCYYKDNCRHCLAINTKKSGELFIGNELCPMQS